MFLNAIMTAFDLYLDESDIVDLDSSSDAKFSHHLIFNIPGNIFENNLQVKAFVNNTINTNNIKCMCKTEKAEKSIIDLSVYSKNRLFRIYLSSKYEKTAILMPFNLSSESFINDSYRLCFFIRSLVSEFWCKSEIDKYNLLRCVEDIIKYQVNPVSINMPDLLRTFILKCVNKGGVSGSIRSYKYLNPNIIVEISNNRWCGNIKRPHKSNHIYLLVNINCGVIYQRCHDDDCKDYQSDGIVIPNEIINDTVKYFDEEMYDIEVP